MYTFFSFKHQTSYVMRITYLSSDVFSSDLCLMSFPFRLFLEFLPRQAADRGALTPDAVEAGRQRDLGAEIRGLDLQPLQLLMLRQRPVHMVDVDDVGLAGFNPRRQDADP